MGVHFEFRDCKNILLDYLMNIHSFLGHKNILVLSTFRSGSSFTGDILSHYPGTYYSYEPIWSLWKVWILFLRGIANLTNISQFQIKDMNITHQVQLLQDLYECKINKLHLKADKFFQMTNCKNNAKKCSDPKYHQKKCLESKQRLVKVVRLQLHHVAHLVPYLNLKMILLHRDPRGVMNSRWKPPASTWHSKFIPEPYISNISFHRCK